MSQSKFRIIKNNFGEGKTFEETLHYHSCVYLCLLKWKAESR